MTRGLLLWDIDGTLVERSSYRSTSIHLRALGKQDQVETSSELTGFTDWEVLKHYEIDDMEVNRAFKKLDLLQESENVEDFARIRGIDDRLFNYLKPNWDHGILSGNSQIRAFFKLRSANLEKNFQTDAIFVCLPYDTREKIALRMLEKFGKKYSRIVLIGDTENDIKTAEKIGLPIIAVATGKYKYSHLVTFNPTLVIENLADDREIFYNFLSSLAM